MESLANILYKYGKFPLLLFLSYVNYSEVSTKHSCDANLCYVLPDLKQGVPDSSA
jgi:hypothetical protein